MPLNAEQEAYLMDVLDAVNENGGALQGWDQDFMDDIMKNYDEKEANLQMTPRMWVQITRIGKTKFGLDFEEYV